VSHAWPSRSQLTVFRRCVARLWRFFTHLLKGCPGSSGRDWPLTDSRSSSENLSRPGDPVSLSGLKDRPSAAMLSNVFQAGSPMLTIGVPRLASRSTLSKTSPWISFADPLWLDGGGIRVPQLVFREMCTGLRREHVGVEISLGALARVLLWHSMAFPAQDQDM
jgi:hypothetical protein